MRAPWNADVASRRQLIMHTVIFVHKTPVHLLRMPESRFRKNTARRHTSYLPSHLRPLGTAYCLRFGPNSRCKSPEFADGKTAASSRATALRGSEAGPPPLSGGHGRRPGRCRGRSQDPCTGFTNISFINPCFNNSQTSSSCVLNL